MGSVAVFTTFDIQRCFHRFLIQGSDRSKTTFAHPFTGVQYQLCHCSFGLTSTNDAVQCVLTKLLADLPYITLYIDALCVFSSGYMSQRVEYVCKALKRLTTEVFYPFYVATGASTYGIGGVVYQAINQEIKYNALLQDLFLLLNVTIIPTNKSSVILT
ncbi:hypothetical protein G6F30_010504 [Rhizopus arrhizus]|nr:hypothetical protein G6F30_010504 [Rhizopus arrhizus]KAG1084875.1 hypothetical protein G6F39_012932 [Rhizopus arrhizus]